MNEHRLWVDSINEGCQNILDVRYGILDTAELLDRVGFRDIASELFAYAKTLQEARALITQGVADEQNRGLEVAREHTGLLLQAALTGVFTSTPAPPLSGEPTKDLK